MADLYLASKSPRRRELLSQIGVIYSVISVNVPEERKEGELPAVYVQRLALEKSLVGFESLAHDKKPVLGADTIVVSDGIILEKPKNQADAVSMLKRLSGNRHQVMTAVALKDAENHQVKLSVSDVDFRVLTEKEIRIYWESGEPKDKAGGYGIQGLGGVFVKNLSGSYSAVVGLPLYETQLLLNEFSVPSWNK